MIILNCIVSTASILFLYVGANKKSLLTSAWIILLLGWLKI